MQGARCWETRKARGVHARGKGESPLAREARAARVSLFLHRAPSSETKCHAMVKS